MVNLESIWFKREVEEVNKLNIERCPVHGMPIV